MASSGAINNYKLLNVGRKLVTGDEPAEVGSSSQGPLFFMLRNLELTL